MTGLVNIARYVNFEGAPMWKTSTLISIFLMTILQGIIHGSFTQYLDLSEWDISTKEHAQNLGQKVLYMLRTNQLNDQIIVLCLAKCKMNSQAFNAFTNSLNLTQETFPNLELLDVSNNILDENAARSLQCWLQYSTDEKPVYINIVGNPISLKKVKRLYEGFKKLVDEKGKKKMSEKEVAASIHHIIFMTAYYVKIAQKKINIYGELVKQKIISEDWAQVHKKFYHSTPLKSFLKYKKLKLHNELTANMKALSLTAPHSRLDAAIDDQASEEEEMSFKQALASILLPVEASEEDSKEDYQKRNNETTH